MEDQFKTIIDGASGATTANFDIIIKDGIKEGSIHAVTNAAYNGTTGTLALQGSNDNTNFITAFEDDNITPMSFTLATTSQYSWLLKRIFYKYYRIVYTKGDTTLGTVTANFIGK